MNFHDSLQLYNVYVKIYTYEKVFIIIESLRVSNILRESM